MKIYKFFLLKLFLSLPVSLFCQSTQTLKLLPSLVPPSPEAAGIARFGNYEVSEFTGVPDISIPLYTVQVGELTVPISLNYHASGIKVSDIASRAGLGWSLDAGGTITRKVAGLVDELPNNYFSATSSSPLRVRDAATIDASTETDLTYLYNVDHRIYDVEPDIFSYSFPGHSGKFLFNQRDSFKAYIIPYSPIAVTKTQPTMSTLNFDIVDESGMDYKFNNYEWASTGGGISVNATSAWKLSDMISSNKQDSIHFIYSSGYGMTDTYFSDYVTFNDGIMGNHYNYNTPTYSTDQGSVYTQWQQLDEIRFKNGKVVIEGSSAARSDFSGEEKAINDIKVFSYDPSTKNYTLIKTIQFFQSYFQNGASRLRLDSLEILSSNNIAVQTYRFDYNLSISLPDNLSRMKDYWGYFNNKTNTNAAGQPTLVPKTVAPFNQPPYAPSTITIGSTNDNGRDPDPNYMQADILQKITFPTGGYTQFTYETNQYLDDQNNPKYAGGLRIKTIKTYENPSATPEIKTYKYGAGESGYGRANFLLASYFFANHQPCRWVGSETNCYPTSIESLNTYFSNPTNDIEGFDGSPVVYPVVTEYAGDSLSNNGKIIYMFSDKADAKTDAIGYGQPYFDSYHFVRGLPTNKLVYKNNGSNSYTLLSEERKGYQYFPFQWSTGGIGLIVSKRLNDDEAGTGDANIGTSYVNNCSPYSDAYNYNFNNYNIVSGDNKLIADTSIVYDQFDPTKYVSTITSYTYDDLIHLALSQTQTVNTKNETITSAYSYPYNYSTAPYTTMILNHIYDKVIQETVTNSVTGQLSQKTNNYSSFGSNFLPANIQLKIKANAVETRASFNQYDARGSILEMQKTNDVKQSIIWDYQGLQPVAEVMNAGQSDIAYTSFEADGKGNWTFTGPTVLDPTSPTGKRCYTLGSSITRSGLSTTTTYIVSYWKKSGTVAVNSTTPVAGRNVAGWTYYEHKVVNPAGGVITVSGTSGVIDELRLYPATNVQMTTYTYAPLVGLTSQCDANNRITYYEYDDFNRLMLIRDQDRNILKQIYYNYAGQTENSAIFYNAVQSGTYYKTGCTGCLTGTAVTYTVPANTYSAPTQSEANQKAIDDVVANGQAYADANGTCTTPANATVTGSNANNQTQTFYFHNNCTGTNYNFSLNANQSTTTLGSVPVGNYNVTFNPPSGQLAYTYKVNTLTLRANSGTISNVTVSAGGVIVTITP